MALTEKVTFLLSVNAKGVAKEFDKVGREADRSLGKAEQRSEQLSATFTKVGAGMVAAGALAGAALYGMAQDASSFAETVDKAAILFGDGMDTVVKFSEEAASQIGVAKDQALDAASTFAIYGKRAGLAGEDLAGFSTELVTAAADMASFNDASLEDTIGAIGSALRGESEPLQRFGVDTRMAALEASALEAGLIGVGEKLDANQVPMAVMAAITGQAADQMDNFQMTSGSAANQAKAMQAQVQNLRLELGEAALPVLKEALTALNSMVTAFNNLPAPIKSVVAQTAVWGSALLVVGGSMLMVVARTKAAMDAISALTTRLGVSRGAMLKWAGAIGVALALQQEWSGARQRATAVDEAANDALVEGATVAENFANILNGMSAGSDDLAAAFGEIDGGAAGVAERFAESGDKGAALTEIIDGLADAGVMSADGMELAADAVAAMANATDGAAAAAESANTQIPVLAGSVDSLYRSSADASAAAEELSGSLGRTYSPAKELRDVMSEVNDQLDDFFDSIGSNQELAADFQAALDDAADSIETNGKAIGIHTEEERANLAARQAVIDEIGRKVDAMVQEGASSDAIVRKSRSMIQAYEDTLVAAGLTREEAQTYSQVLGDIPEEVRTQLEMADYDSTIAQAIYLRDLYASIPRNITTTMSVVSLTGTPGYGPQASDSAESSEAADRSGRMLDRGGRTRSRFSDAGGSTGADGRSVNLTTVVELDGRQVAKSLERVSERDGGLRVKLRAGG